MGSHKILQNKVSVRDISSKHPIEREKLLAKLDKARHYPLTMITAPAGYGKTTLATQWYNQQQRKGRQVAWYAIDSTDNNPIQFARYFSALITQVTGVSLPAFDADQDKLIDYMNQLLNQLSDIQVSFSLMIDNYQSITNKDIHDALRLWLRHQPSTIHLILLSRTLPPLRLTKWKIDKRLLLIEAKQLAFSTDEAYDFLAKKLPHTVLQKDKVAQLNQQIEGWVIALQLVSLVANRYKKILDKPEKVFDNLNHQDIECYLEEEVFYHLDKELKNFMVHCAILRVVNEKLAVELTQDTDSLRKLYALEKQGLFITRIEGKEDNIYWRFSPIISAYLTLQCRLTLPTKWQSLHLTAAKMWLQLGNYSEALYHAQHLDDTDLLYAILQKHGWELFHQGKLERLDTCLNKLPQDHVLNDESLVLLQAWLAQSQHRYYEVNEILAKLNPEKPLAEPMQAKFTALKSQVAMNAGDDELAYQLANEAIVNIPTHASYARIVALSVIGEAQHCRGELKSALTTMSQVEKLAASKKIHHYWLWSKLQQAEILLAQGYLQSAYELLESVELTIQPLPQIPMHEFLYRLKGQILWEWNQLDETEIAADRGLRVAKGSDKAQCFILLAKTSLTQGKLDNAERLINECQQLLTLFPVHNDWFIGLDEVQLMYWQMKEETDALESWLAQTTIPTHEKNHFTQRQWRNIARCYLLQQQFDEALDILNRIIKTAQSYDLISDLQRALILRSRAYFLKQEKQLAQDDLVCALGLSRQTNFISAFVIEGDVIAQQMRKCLQTEKLDELTTHKAQFILRRINQCNQHKFAHFDEKFVEKLLQTNGVPELLKISPLTLREWQVLGLIYSGYSNDQIAQELVVKITTVKTHVRNLYQKLGVANRREVIKYTEELLAIVGR